MPSLRTIVILGFTVFALIVAYVLFSLYSAKEAEQKLRIQKEQELSSKIAELTQKQEELSNLSKEKSEMEEQYKAAIAKLEVSLKEESDNGRTLAKRIEDLTQEKENLGRSIASNEQLIIELSKKIKKLETERADLQSNLKRLQEEKEKASVPRESRLADGDLPEEFGPEPIPSPADIDPVRLGKIVVQRSTGAVASVEHVNKLYGFIVLSAGTADGIQKASVVNIVRNNRFIGKAYVEQVRENVAAAVILPEYTKEEIREGDLVTKF